MNPEIIWETISTPHFEMVYDAKHYQTAKKYALRLELNHQRLTSYFSEAPERTVVVLNDNTDLANGYATPIPYSHMMIYPVLPTSHDSISEYADWPQELTLHEYAHILNFQPAHGSMAFLRSFMGTIISPTLLLPRWWHEGIAVEMETRFSQNGRLRSLYQEATLRALVKAQQLKLYSVADINEGDLESWPRGARPYLFGSLILSEIQSQKGGTINDTLLQRYSRRVPYFLDGPAIEETGKSFENWFEDSLKSLATAAQHQLRTIHQAPPTSFTPLSNAYLDSHSPQISPNGNILTFVAKNHWGKSSIQIFDRHEEGRSFDLQKDLISEFLSIDSKTEGTSKDSPPAGNINRISWLPDSSGFIFDQVRFVDSYSNYSDLFFYDLKKKKNRRITTGARLRDAGLSPDGLKIAAVQLEQSNSQLVSLDFEGKNLQVLYTPPAFHKIANPLFIDDHTLLFTERDLNGVIILKKMELESKAITPINLSNLKQIDSLNQELKGISFVAHENGMQNFYFTPDYFKTYRRLTHTETAIFDGSIDARTNWIYTTVMTETGLQVMSHTTGPLIELDAVDLATTAPMPPATMAKGTAQSVPSSPSPPPRVEPLFPQRYPSTINNPTEEALEAEWGPKIGPRTPYSSLSYLRPRYWLPFIYASDNSYGLEISIASFDPLEKHSYTLQAGYDSFARESHFNAGYENTTTTWPLHLFLHNESREQPIIKSRYEANQLTFLATHDLRPFSENMTFGFGFDGTVTTTVATRKRWGPEMLWIYDSTGKSTFSKTPFSGYQFSLFANQFVKTQELFPLTRGVAKASYYHSHFLPERHIALIHLMAQQMEGDIFRQDLSTSENYYVASTFVLPRFVLRGYDPGYFYFWNARSATFEYQLPLWGYKGWGTNPAFLKRTHLNLYGEALAIDGDSIDYKTNSYVRRYLKDYFSSYGMELKADLTIGYYLPLTLILGLYQRPDYSGDGKTSTFIGLQM